jgi:hypothetical protein
MDRPIVHAIEVPIPDFIGALVPGAVVIWKSCVQKFPVLQGIVGGLLTCHLVLIFLLIIGHREGYHARGDVQPDTTR